MEDVVGLIGIDSKRYSVAFMTWGRLFDRVDDSRLIEIVSARSKNFVGAPIKSIRICGSLNDVSGYKYFFDALLHFAWRPIPFGTKTYDRWRAATRKKLISGEELYFLGRLSRREPK